MPRMRTILECVAYIKEHDPETCVTKFFIRKLCLEEKIRFIKSGKKFLIDLDGLLEFLANGA